MQTAEPSAEVLNACQTLLAAICNMSVDAVDLEDARLFWVTCQNVKGGIQRLVGIADG